MTLGDQFIQKALQRQIWSIIYRVFLSPKNNYKYIGEGQSETFSYFLEEKNYPIITRDCDCNPHACPPRQEKSCYSKAGSGGGEISGDLGGG